MARKTAVNIRILILARLVTHPHFMRTDCASARLTVQFHSSALTIRIEIIIGHKASMTISKRHTDNIGTVILCVL